MIYAGNHVPRYDYFTNYAKVEQVTDFADHIDEADLLILLDGSQFSRFSKNPEALAHFAGKTICIDHHSSPIDRFSLALVDPSSPANAQNIYLALLSRLDLPQHILETLLLGILGDTGIFSYLRPDQLRTLDIAKKILKKANLEVQDFLSRYSTISPEVFAVIQELIKNTVNDDLAGWPSFTYSLISREWFESRGYSDEVRSDATHIFMSQYLRTITGHPWGFILTPKSDGNVSLSLRSLPGSISVRLIVENMGIGGGHDRAAGGTFKSADGSKVNPQDSLNQLLMWIENADPSTLR